MKIEMRGEATGTDENDKRGSENESENEGKGEAERTMKKKLVME